MRCCFLTLLTVLALGLPALCVGSYCALANHRRGTMGALHPDYRLGGKIASEVFWPIEWLDRRMRPLHWGPVGYPMKSFSEVSGFCLRELSGVPALALSLVKE
jgi:hypothetical protein